MIKPVVFENEGQQIIGILHIPDNIKVLGRCPGIIMLHGFTGNKTEAHRLFVHIARALCRLGFTVLRFDFRGSGDSDGEFEDMTILDELSDAKRALDFLLKRRIIDRERVGVIGLSMGGRVAAILASMDERIKFVILYSPAIGSLRERFLGLISEEALKKLMDGEPVEVSSGWYLKWRFFETIDYIIPLNVMDKIKVPVLIVHGDRDQVIPVEESLKGYNLIKNLNAKNRLHIVKGADHTFSRREHLSEVIEETSKWIRSLD